MASSAERIRRYRERLKQDPEKYAAYLIKEKERSQSRRAKEKNDMAINSSKVHKAVLKLKRLRQNERQRKCREKKKTKKDLPKSNSSTDSYAVNPIGSYRVPATFKKALVRVRKNLPESPRKKEAIVRYLATSLNICSELFPTKLSSSEKSPEDYLLVSKFYERDDISRQAPGKRDYISIIDENGKRVHKQRRHMFTTIDEARAIFCEQYPNINVSRTKFFELRPRHVLPSSKMPHNVCVCKYHANMDFMLKAVPNLKIKAAELCDLSVCSQFNEDCILSNCGACDNRIGEVLLGAVDEDELAVEVFWKAWKKVEGRDKIVDGHNEGDNVATLVSEITDAFPKYLAHSYIQKLQDQHFQQSRDKIDADEAIIQLDFSENYAVLTQDEIQAAHWSNDQITIFTTVAWLTSNKCQSFVIVSDDMVHGKYAVWTFLKVITQSLKSQYPDIQKVHIFSDGSSAQFKNKYNLMNLSFFKKDFGLDCVWSFFATSHGKGAVDGIGGTVKRAVAVAVLTRKYTVRTAEEFVVCARSVTKSISVILVPKSDVEKCTNMLDERWENINAIPNTHFVHHVVPVPGKHGVLKVGSTFSSTLSEITIKEFEQDEQDKVQCEEINTQLTDQEIMTIEECIEKYVVVEYKSKLVGNKLVDLVKPLYYLGYCNRMQGDKICMQYLRKKNGKLSYYVFPAVDDFDTDVAIEQVKCYLPTPTKVRGKLYFKDSKYLNLVLP